jgi:Ca-activated chloride channel homolog
MLEYVSPNWLWVLLIIPIIIVVEIIYKQKHRVRLYHSQVEVLRKISPFSGLFSYIPFVIRIIAICLIIIALARPRLAHQQQIIHGKGIDIVLSLDISGSMKALDFKPVNRLEAAKKIANDFIEKRRHDRLGIVVFAENAFTKCPLTLDYHILKTIMNSIEIDEEKPGTAIGMGLATAVARLKDSDAETKIVILLTDGENNAGEIGPETAAQLASTYRIKVYPIGIGSHGEVDFPFQTPRGIVFRKVKIGYDMETLHHIAKVTGTEFAREARNSEELAIMLNQIDQLEKAEFEIENYFRYQELFWYFLVGAFALLIFELILKKLVWKELP